MASVIKDFELVERINARLVPDAQEVLTPGEAMAGMILTGRGCANRPLSLTPPLFANTPLARLCRAGMRAERLHRFQRGRTRDEASPDGCALWFHELALVVCAHEDLALRCPPLDTTSVALHGAYVPEREAQAMPITYGSSTAHRPALKPAVLDRMVSHAGGVPCGSKRWDGHPSELKVVQERAQARLAAFQQAPRPRYLIAAAQRSHEDKAPTLQPLGWITRIPPPGARARR
jgi:Domain of unknown function (DUF4277)